MPAPYPIPSNPPKHTSLEDIQGLAIGLVTSAIGLSFLAQLGFITGQTAGLALVISYLTGLSFSWIFWLINIPFYILAYYRIGTEFTLKSVISVTALSILMAYIPPLMQFKTLDPFFGTIAFGVLTGFGLLGVFRHKSSLGGLGVLALIAQDHFGIRAGYVQIAFDAILFAVAFFLFDAHVVLYSLFGALILNAVIAFNHRRDIYIAS
ncbi:putative 5xTM membrane YitT family protein [Pacificibacter maritimus]|uniref:Putative 5xTM membrane YitT family protein n=1 Tax=Pacificibacter maritimus TaxID=762213 RepID=A0A3N4UM29_9RHOB|nr:YitT family protein [Pacificibacter maritimus]RPE71696.1 putative 5xTM membrane YitT family protein [Pacificibacter maritimus]